jgi:hypothetical protein
MCFKHRASLAKGGPSSCQKNPFYDGFLLMWCNLKLLTMPEHVCMTYDKRYGNIYRTRHTNIQPFIQMLSLTHTHNEMTYDKRYGNIYNESLNVCVSCPVYIAVPLIICHFIMGVCQREHLYERLNVCVSCPVYIAVPLHKHSNFHTDVLADTHP